MKLALLGYGAMNRLVHVHAQRAGLDVPLIFTGKNIPQDEDELANKLAEANVAIDFSVAEAVPRHVAACARAGVALVEGTTGWKPHLDAVRETIEQHNAAFIYGANFSIGVNVFYRIAAHAAKLFAQFGEYDVFLEEAHHARKRDAPSGTALRLRELVIAEIGKDISVASTRAGYIPGTHRVGFDSPADQVLLEHTARSREGFAAGALLAARWISGRHGFYEFTQVIDEVVTSDE